MKMNISNFHRKLGVRLSRKFSISPENTARLINFLAREYPTLCLAQRALTIDGERLRTIRRARRWTIRRLAKKLGMSVQQIANIEKGRSGTTQARLLAFAEILNISPEELSK